MQCKRPEFAPWVRKIPGRRGWLPLQYFGLENPMDRGAWQAAVQFSSVQSLSCVQLFVTPWTAARQSSLSFTISQSLLRLLFIELMMPSKHLILCHPLLLLPSVFSNIGIFSSDLALCIRWPKCWSFSFSFSVFLYVSSFGGIKKAEC